MSPEEARAWIKVFRDVAIVVVGIFILVHETLFAPAPDAYLIGAGLLALGLPPAFRFDEQRRSKSEEDEPPPRKKVTRR